MDKNGQQILGEPPSRPGSSASQASDGLPRIQMDEDILDAAFGADSGGDEGGDGPDSEPGSEGLGGGGGTRRRQGLFARLRSSHNSHSDSSGSHTQHGGGSSSSNGGKRGSRHKQHLIDDALVPNPDALADDCGSSRKRLFSKRKFSGDVRHNNSLYSDTSNGLTHAEMLKNAAAFRLFTQKDPPFENKEMAPAPQGNVTVGGLGPLGYARTWRYRVLLHVCNERSLLLLLELLGLVAALSIFFTLLLLPHADDLVFSSSQESRGSCLADGGERAEVDDSPTPSSVAIFSLVLTKLLVGSNDGSSLVPRMGSLYMVVIWHLLSFTNLVLFVVGVAITLYRLTRPQAGVEFASWCVISSDGLTHRPSLEFRIANLGGLTYPLVDAHISVSLSFSPPQGNRRRRFLNLQLVANSQAHMPVFWTVSHILNEKSPLYGQSWEALVEQSANIHVVFRASDPRTMTDVIASHIYDTGRILFDAELHTLIDSYPTTPSESVVLNYANFHKVGSGEGAQAVGCAQLTPPCTAWAVL